MTLFLTEIIVIVCLIKFEEDDIIMTAKVISPQVKSAFISSFSCTSQYEVLVGCYMESQSSIIVHVNRVRGLPATKKIIIKIEVNSEPYSRKEKQSTHKSTGTIVYDMYKRVRIILYK